jgi:hypothetical protein
MLFQDQSTMNVKSNPAIQPTRNLRLYLVAILIASLGMPVAAKTIRFSGYEWVVKDGSMMGPGPNEWDKANAFVDEQGHLHLRISYKSGRWYSAEVTTVQRFGFGTYQFVVDGYVDRLNKNVVLGLFNYPTLDIGPDGTNEIDIEFTRFGNEGNRIGNFSVAPANNGVDVISRSFPVSLRSSVSLHTFHWHPTSVLFASAQGEGLGSVHCDDANSIVTALYQPEDPSRQIPQQPLPIHINLWLFRGLPPTDGKPVEIVIRAFKFRPAENDENRNPFERISSLCSLKLLTEARLPHTQFFGMYIPHSK